MLPAFPYNPSINESYFQKTSRMATRSLAAAGCFTYEMTASVGTFLIAGIGIRIFFPFLSAPFFGISATLITTRVVVKLLNVYNVDLLKNIKHKASNISHKYPNLQVITLVFAIVISFISPVLGFALAGAVGVYGGVVVEINLAEKKQKTAYKPSQKISDSRRRFVEE